MAEEDYKEMPMLECTDSDVKEQIKVIMNTMYGNQAKLNYRTDKLIVKVVHSPFDNQQSEHEEFLNRKKMGGCFYCGETACRLTHKYDTGTPKFPERMPKGYRYPKHK